jgi:hypothetical protein
MKPKQGGVNTQNLSGEHKMAEAQEAHLYL